MKKLLRDWMLSPDEGGGGGGSATEAPPADAPPAAATPGQYLDEDPDLDDDTDPPAEAAPTEEAEVQTPAEGPAAAAEVSADAALEALAKANGITVEEAKARLLAQPPAAEPPAEPGKPENPRAQAIRELKSSGKSEADDDWFDAVDSRTWDIVEERREEAVFTAQTMQAVSTYEAQLEQMKLPKEAAAGIAPRLATTIAAFGPKAAAEPGHATMALDMSIGYFVRTQLAAGKDPLPGLVAMAKGEETPEPKADTPPPVTGSGGNRSTAHLDKLDPDNKAFVDRWSKRFNEGKPPTPVQLQQLRDEGLII